MDRDTSTSMPSWTLRVTNALGYLLLILVNVASNTGLLGPTNGEISRKFETPLTPAGWAFSIWGLIFGLQGLGAVYQLLPYGYAPDGWKQRIVNTIGYGWQLGWYFEMAWQLTFLLQSHEGMWVSMFLLIGALTSFGLTLRRLYRLKDQYGSLSNVLLYAAFFLPTSVNTAWLSVATCLGILIVPVSYGVTRHMEVYATVLAAVVTLAGVAIVQRNKDSVYGWTLVWSLVAVYGKQRSSLVKMASLVCLVIMCVASIFAMLRRRSPLLVTELSSDMRQPLARSKSRDGVPQKE
ncbi:hypothetical protein WJX72_005930 [[Myrmecia] bisecta]|uniref:Tryptophan-rich sensory protein n=1 Tax=[Myrmecia] bisecta TaxID=41462 RepID=A0AAW1R743_9CHLO